MAITFPSFKSSSATPSSATSTDRGTALAKPAEQARSNGDSFLAGPKRLAQAALEIPKGIANGAMIGVAVVGLPMVLVPPLFPLFLPFLPAAALFGSAQGALTGSVNALGRLAEGDDFKPMR